MKLLAISTFAVLLLAGAAGAAETTTVAIHARLDPNTPAERQMLLRRIDTAALEACGAQRGSLIEVKRAVAASACHRDAVAGAVAQLKTSQAALDAPNAR